MKRIRSFKSVPSNTPNNYSNKKNHFDDNTTDPRSVFTKLSDIGKGCFGVVSQILYLPEMQLLAGKFLNPALINDSTKKIIQHDIEQACKITSKNINPYYGCVTFEESLIILTEFCEHGSLRDILNEKKKTFSEDQISIILFDLLTGIYEIHHNLQLVHRNIKSSNLLLSSECEIKITDLILTNHVEFFDTEPTDSLSCQTVGIIGTPYWMAPEIISKSEFSFPSDIWSIGITAIELSEGSPPYIEFTPSKAMVKIVKDGFPGFRFPDKHSSEFKDFVSHCLKMKPASRWSCEKLLEHPFIKRAKKLNREKVLQDLIQIEIPHLKANSNLLKKNKSKNDETNSLLLNNNQIFYNQVVASSIVPHPEIKKNNDNDNDNGNENENDTGSNYRNYFNFSSIKNLYPFNNAPFKSVSNLKLSPRLKSLIKGKRESYPPETSNEKFSDFIDHSNELDKKEENELLSFISKARELNSQLNFVPFEIATNQNADITSIYVKEKKIKLKKAKKAEISEPKPNFFQRLPLKIFAVLLLFLVAYNFDFNVTFALSAILIICCFLNYFVISKK